MESNECVNEAKYLEIVENTPLCIKVFDAQGKLTFLSKGGRKEHFIKDDADISEWDWRGTVKKEYQATVEKVFQQALAGEEGQVELEHTPEGSDHQWCLGMMSPIKDKNGVVKSVLFYSINIDERKKIENRLKEKIAELEKTHNLMIGREMKMIELKKEINKK